MMLRVMRATRAAEQGPRSRGCDPGAAQAADARSSAFRTHHGGGALSSNARTALVLASIALAFFIGVMVRHWQW
jgi:hypothetical protein